MKKMKAILGTKKQMTQVFTEDGKAIGCTIVDVSDVKCVGVRTIEKDGYSAMIIGIGKKKNPSKPLSVKYKDLGYVPEKIIEIRTDAPSVNVGDSISGSVFTVGDKVDVIGFTKGKGFQGVMKAHGMKGGPKTHGQSTKPRSVGSIAPGQTYAHVMKGRRMAKKIGNERVTVKNLKVMKVLDDENIILIKGAVPGMSGSKILVRSK